jgi:hypothetical protein
VGFPGFTPDLHLICTWFAPDLCLICSCPRQGYGNVGLTMGFPGKDYSLSGALTDVSKVAAGAGVNQV